MVTWRTDLWTSSKGTRESNAHQIRTANRGADLQKSRAYGALSTSTADVSILKQQLVCALSLINHRRNKLTALQQPTVTPAIKWGYQVPLQCSWWALGWAVGREWVFGEWVSECFEWVIWVSNDAQWVSCSARSVRVEWVLVVAVSSEWVFPGLVAVGEWVSESGWVSEWESEWMDE